MPQKKIWFWSRIHFDLLGRQIAKQVQSGSSPEFRGQRHEIAEMVQVIKKYREGGHLVGRRKKPWTSWGDEMMVIVLFGTPLYNIYLLRAFIIHEIGNWGSHLGFLNITDKLQGVLNWSKYMEVVLTILKLQELEGNQSWRFWTIFHFLLQ